MIISLSLIHLINCASEPERPILKKITITSSNGAKLDLGATTSLTASGIDQFNGAYTLSNTIIWSASNENISIDQQGNVTALEVGTSLVTATTELVEGTFTITIWDSSAPRTEVYVSDLGNFEQGPWKILKYNEDGSNPEVFTNTHVNQPQDVLFLEDQDIVLVSNYRGSTSSTGRITKYNSTTGAYLGDFATNLPGPTRIKIGPDDLLYILLWDGTNKVRRYQLDGTFVDAFTSVGINEGIGLDWDTNGNLYVSSFSDGQPGYVRKFDPSGNDLGLFISTNLVGPTNIWFDGDGNLLVSDWTAGNVKRFDANGVFLGTFITGLNQVEGAGFFVNGNILLGNGGNSSVKMYTENGIFIRDFVPAGGGSEGLIRPNGITVRRVNF